MEFGLSFWKQNFGRTIETEWDSMQQNFQAFILEGSQILLDDYQMHYIWSLMDPSYSRQVKLGDFIVFLITFWTIPSKRNTVFNYTFLKPELMQPPSDVESLEIQITKSPPETIQLLKKGTSILITQHEILINQKIKQKLKKSSHVVFGSDLQLCDVIFPEEDEINPIHFQIGLGSEGYFIQDVSQYSRLNYKMDSEFPLVLSFLMVFQIGHNDRFMVQQIFPIPPQEDKLRDNYAIYFDTNERPFQNEVEEIKKQIAVHQPRNVAEFRENSLQDDQQYEQEVKKSEADETKPFIVLECIEGEQKGKFIQFTTVGMGNKGYSFGKNDKCDVILKDTSVSLNHCSIVLDPQFGWVLREEQKTLGTFVYYPNYLQLENKQASQNIPIKDHFNVKVSGYEMQLKYTYQYE